MTTIYTWVPAPQHEYPDHPEQPGRLAELETRLPSFHAERLEAAPAAQEEIASVHAPHMISSVESACREGPEIIDYAPTFVTRTSFRDALLASGGTLGCSRAVLAGEADNAYAIVRPPGHHAEPSRAMGFCLFNNIAIAARDALARGLVRVMVVDFDAHHGNGTEAAFWDDERLAYISTHQWGIYPGTGRLDEAPHAKNRIVNVPLPPFAGDACFEQITDRIIRPAFEIFSPQLILVSAGFDSHRDDPLTSLGLSSAGFYSISKRLVELAGEHCRGKIVFVLEGGYDPYNVANGSSAVFAALTGEAFVNPEERSGSREPDIEQMVDAVRAFHRFH
jgi:acetoin utilization deacetylase AcuC-like enzyme